MMNRIEERMKALQTSGKKALITYITAGLPNLDKTKELIIAQAEAGVDVIELGIPFSDPVADGPVIQAASYQAILNGTNVRKVFNMMEQLRRECSVPIIFMMYYNTLHHYGLEDFAVKCAACGVDGLIVPDLPFEEQKPLQEALARVQEAPILIQLVAPVSKQRIPMLLENARGFVYCVSQMGVTGKEANFYADIHDYLASVKAVSKVPVMMGFGIRSAVDVQPVQDVIDGAIVGSAFIRLMEQTEFSAEAAKEYVSTFKTELNA